MAMGLIFKDQSEMSVRSGEVAGFFTEIGATVGHSVYDDLKQRKRDGKELTPAKTLNHKPEADWLARQMTAATGKTSGKDPNP